MRDVREILEDLDITLSGQDFELGLDVIDADPGDRYLLIEENVRAHPSHWVSTHATLGDAADYSLSQEYAEDWTAVLLVDRLTGGRYEPELSLSWTERS